MGSQTIAMRAAPLSDSNQARAARAPATQPDQTGESSRIARGVFLVWSNHVARGAVLPWMSTSAAGAGRASLPGAAQERSRKGARRSPGRVHPLAGARRWVGVDIEGWDGFRRPGSAPGYGAPGHGRPPRTVRHVQSPAPSSRSAGPQGFSERQPPPGNGPRAP
jgi:hypothetical protein